MKKTRFEQMQEEICRRLEPEQGPEIAAQMRTEYDALCAIPRPQALERHTHNNIYPVAAAFRSLLKSGMERPQAAQLARDAFLELMQSPAAAIQKMMKVPGLYRLMPWLWKTLMPRLFSQEAGFRFHFCPTDRHQVKFDMLACPYHRICLELDCPELAPVFCMTDDICYGHMHRKLIWNRTKTIAGGSDLCDFDLYIRK